MRVDGRGQAVMEILRLRDHATAEVDSLHHTARRHDPQHRIKVRVVLDTRRL